MSWRQAHKIIKEKNLRYSVLSKEKGISSDRRSKLVNDGWIRVCKNMYMFPKSEEEVNTEPYHSSGATNWEATFQNSQTSGELSRLFKDIDGIVLQNMVKGIIKYEREFLYKERLEKRKEFYKFKCKNTHLFI